VLERIRKLAIPPAWTNVWICKKPNGHIQATGYDLRNRKQYRYHEQWHTLRNETKISPPVRVWQITSLPAPEAGERISRKKNLCEEKVLATVSA
jgi:DNA topoisomerase-1